MPTRWPRIPLATLCCLLALATSAYAEGAWSLWFQQYIIPAPVAPSRQVGT